MKNRNLHILLVLILALFSGGNIVASQSQFRIIKFENTKGLTSNLIKDIAQDNNGFIWIATDGGLLKYDGSKFIAYNDSLPSIYLKDLFLKKDGSLLVATDLSVSKIINQNDEVKVEEVIEGKTFFTDSLLFYPKKIFEDNENNIWISDNRSLTKYKNGKSQKYIFEGKYLSDDYISSFSPAQNRDGDVFTASHSGFLLKLNKTKNNFELIQTDLPKNNFYNSLKFIGDWFYLASAKGLFRFKEVDGLIITEKISGIKNISSVSGWNNNKIIFGTNYNGVYIFDPPTHEITEIEELKTLVVKNIFEDRENGIWIASDQGLFLLKKNLFKKINLDEEDITHENFYIRKVNADTAGNIFFTTKDDLYLYDPNSRSTTAQRINQHYKIYDFATRFGDYWISTRQSELIKLTKNHQIIYKTELNGERASHLTFDSENVLWSYLEESHTVLSVDENYHQTKYALDFDDNIYIESLKEIDGDIYISGVGNEMVLSKFNKETEKFESIVMNKNSKSQTSIFDFDKTSDGNFYLATNRGLWKLTESGIVSVKFPHSSNKPVIKSIYINDEDEIWCGSDFGLFFIKNDGFIFFDQKDGLPNSTVSLHGITASKDGIWIGTPSGLSYFNKHETLSRLSKPKIIDVRFNKENNIYNYPEDKLLSGINLSAIFSTLSYPSDRTTYSTRLKGLDSSWTVQGSATRLNIQNIPSGDFILQVKADNPGMFESEIMEFPFSVADPWYFSKQIIPFYILAALTLMLIGNFYFNKYRLKRALEREKLLNQKVLERTDELNKERIKTKIAFNESEKAKRQLQAANELKGQLLSIAAHDLKNPLQVILGYEFYKEDMNLTTEEEEMLESIFTAAKKMLGMISETLESAAADATQLALILKQTNLTEIIKSSVNEQKILAARKYQEIELRLNAKQAYVNLDKFWFKEALDNLISNAIKYSPKDSRIRIILIELTESFLLEIVDDGPGFSKEDKIKLFQKFQRLSAAPTGGESSTGLGLFIVKQILDRHNFDISLESEIGNGSKFIIEIPKITHSANKNILAEMNDFRSN